MNFEIKWFNILDLLGNVFSEKWLNVYIVVFWRIFIFSISRDAICQIKKSK